MTVVEVFIICCAVFAGGFVVGTIVGSVLTEERIKKEGENVE